MQVVPIDIGHVGEAADVLAQVMHDDPVGSFLIPDPIERLDHGRRHYRWLIERALDEGRVDALGNPVVAVAVWLRRPALEGPAPARSHTTVAASPPLPPEALERLDRIAEVMRLLRRASRPDEHVYLDTLGTLPGWRRQGLATRLLAAGHAWADRLKLPRALDTETDENVGFYRRRGYRVIASANVPGSELRITAMRYIGQTGEGRLPDGLCHSAAGRWSRGQHPRRGP